jgi:hypothetical protein
MLPKKAIIEEVAQINRVGAIGGYYFKTQKRTKVHVFLWVLPWGKADLLEGT